MSHYNYDEQWSQWSAKINTQHVPFRQIAEEKVRGKEIEDVLSSTRQVCLLWNHKIVHYESINREVKRRLIYEYRCDERLKTKSEESMWRGVSEIFFWISIKRELKRRPIYEYRYNERLKTKTEESTRLSDTGLVVELEHLKRLQRITVNVSFFLPCV
jgi:hypothetical protein